MLKTIFYSGLGDVDVVRIIESAGVKDKSNFVYTIVSGNNTAINSEAIDDALARDANTYIFEISDIYIQTPYQYINTVTFGLISQQIKNLSVDKNIIFAINKNKITGEYMYCVKGMWSVVCPVIDITEMKLFKHVFIDSRNVTSYNCKNVSYITQNILDKYCTISNIIKDKDKIFVFTKELTKDEIEDFICKLITIHQTYDIKFNIAIPNGSGLMDLVVSRSEDLYILKTDKYSYIIGNEIKETKSYDEADEIINFAIGCNENNNNAEKRIYPMLITYNEKSLSKSKLNDIIDIIDKETDIKDDRKISLSLNVDVLQIYGNNFNALTNDCDCIFGWIPENNDQSEFANLLNYFIDLCIKNNIKLIILERIYTHDSNTANHLSAPSSVFKISTIINADEKTYRIVKSLSQKSGITKEYKSQKSHNYDSTLIVGDNYKYCSSVLSSIVNENAADALNTKVIDSYDSLNELYEKIKSSDKNIEYITLLIDDSIAYNVEPDDVLKMSYLASRIINLCKYNKIKLSIIFVADKSSFAYINKILSEGLQYSQTTLIGDIDVAYIACKDDYRLIKCKKNKTPFDLNIATKESKELIEQYAKKVNLDLHQESYSDIDYQIISNLIKYKK